MSRDVRLRAASRRFLRLDLLLVLSGFILSLWVDLLDVLLDLAGVALARAGVGLFTPEWFWSWAVTALVFVKLL
ncbi:hypothetical protein [Deinococcus sedimenti]|uniref:Uncharacterized protein n=1 Tax=Deinococcus sedimenti TaxID=1867090 RepID=A0ABQ2S5T7_9DEIO|nr:hypothetical protein [Deinococcus sedimenti]GGR98119.1 hypothetical protein GCM10008960_25930 [Deinococcus sedimenti]